MLLQSAITHYRVTSGGGTTGGRVNTDQQRVGKNGQHNRRVGGTDATHLKIWDGELGRQLLYVVENVLDWKLLVVRPLLGKDLRTDFFGERSQPCVRQRFGPFGTTSLQRFLLTRPDDNLPSTPPLAHLEGATQKIPG